MNHLVLEGRKAIVTGGAQGLGAAISEHLAEEGCDVIIWDINAAQAEQMAREIAAKTGRHLEGRAVDVTDAEGVRRAVDEAVQVMGRLDIMVCNAGILISGDSITFDIEKWRKVIDVDLTGYFICAREAARVMLPNRKGVIIQINSKSGKKGSFRNSAYAAAKFGGIGVTQSLALEFAEQGIRVNAVCPGNLLNSPLWVNSLFKQYAANQGITEGEVRQKYIDQVPMKRPCEYRDVTNVVVFLASDASSYMTGQAINVTGGQEMR
ncbi:MAG TPA: sorbitol-6-phosphate dehydrogenase [Candidatus Hydrogenedentes bacterium]|nr:sorbitol-6-phosphate dehydrogenase [Candidatus Hydrogenedentota bacterium]HOK88417.1 sorbitol-6-phosphate dehydrogenase [Candidatus Hydrogenedentota bacterium]